MLLHKVLVTSFVVVTAANISLSFAQEPTSKFEVASVKPCRGDTVDRQDQGRITPGRISLGCVSAMKLVQIAYGAFADESHLNKRPLMVLNGPGWLESELYEITATSEGPAAVGRLVSCL